VISDAGLMLTPASARKLAVGQATNGADVASDY